jgi:hypothetical protein
MEVKIVQENFTVFLWFALLGGQLALFKAYFGRIAAAFSRKVFMNKILQDIFFIKKKCDHDHEATSSIHVHRLMSSSSSKL